MTHTISDQVEALIKRLAPQPVCEDCITARLGLPEPEHAIHKVHELAGMDGFERQIGTCSLCAIEKQIVRRKV